MIRKHLLKKNIVYIFKHIKVVRFIGKILAQTENKGFLLFCNKVRQYGANFFS